MAQDTIQKRKSSLQRQNMSDVLGMTMKKPVVFFEHIPKIHRLKYKQIMCWIRICDIRSTSNKLYPEEEAQRMKLASELHKRV